MTSAAVRVRRGVVAAVLLGVGVLGTAGCSVFGSDTGDRSGNSTEENVDLADAVAERIADEIPGATVTATYRDDVTAPATLALTVRVTDAGASLAAVTGETIPAGTLLDDAGRPLAPIAVVAARVAWRSQVDPLGSLLIDVVPGGDAAAGDSWNLGVDTGDTAAAFDRTFGDRP